MICQTRNEHLHCSTCQAWVTLSHRSQWIQCCRSWGPILHASCSDICSCSSCQIMSVRHWLHHQRTITELWLKRQIKYTWLDVKTYKKSTYHNTPPEPNSASHRRTDNVTFIAVGGDKLQSVNHIVNTTLGTRETSSRANGKLNRRWSEPITTDFD